MRVGDSGERRNIHPRDRHFLCGLDPLSPRPRTAEIRRRLAMLGNIFLILIAVLLFGYLLVALLKPEKF
jgi:K+-transporting ATPase KdpF subunit